MSEKNLEVVRRLLDAIDRDDLPAALACLDQDLEWIPRRAPIEGAYHGHAGYEQFVADTKETWETFELHPELHPLQDGRVLAWGTISVRGAGSGAEMDVPVGGVFDFRGGKIARWHDFGSKEKALEALGLREENIERVRSIYAAWERGDFSSASWAHPDIEYVQADGPEAGTWKGLPAMAEQFREFLATWQDWRVEAEEYRELDADRVMVLFRFSAQGKGSGVEVGRMRTEGATIFHMRDGKVAKMVQYLDRRAAFESVGLAEGG